MVTLITGQQECVNNEESHVLKTCTNMDLTDAVANFAQDLAADHTAVMQLAATNNLLSTELHHQQQAHALLKQQLALVAKPPCSNPHIISPPHYPPQPKKNSQ